MQSDEGSLSSKKRNRTSTVSIACVSCRSKHIKCDGKSPCDNCKKKGIECSYQKTPVKRGPTSGTIIWLKKVVSGLTEELSKQTEASKQWQAKYDTLMQNVNKKSLGPGSLANTPIVPLEQLNAFVNSYMTRCFKYFRINPPISLTNDTVEDELKIGCVTAMAAYGAIAVGNEAVGFDFANKARIIVSGKFDNVNPVVAATYFILSSLYAYRFDSEREYFFNENALAMTDRLLKKTRVKMLDGIDIEHLYQIAHLASLCYKYSDNPQPLTEFLKNLGQRQDLLDFCLLNLLHKIYGGVFHVLSTNDSNQIEFLYTRLSVLDSLETVVNSVGPEAEKFLLRIDTLRAFIHLVLTQDESADYRANRALAKFDKLPAPENGIMLVMMPLYLLAQIFMYRNQTEQMQQVLELLSNNIRTYSSLSSALEILLDHSPDLHDMPKNTQQHQNTVFATNYVYPRLELYRMNAVRWASQMNLPPPSTQQLLPIKPELGSNPKLPATPPYNTAGPIEGIVVSRSAVPSQPKVSESKSSAFRSNNAMSTGSSPGSGNNTPSGNQSGQPLRVMPEHQVYGHQFSTEYNHNVNAVPSNSVVTNTVPLSPHQQPRRPNSSMAAPHLTESAHFIPPEYYQMSQQQLAANQQASQRPPMYAQPQAPHMVANQQMSSNSNRMPMNTNASNNNMNGHSNMDHEQYQYYPHPHSQPDAAIFQQTHPHNPYMTQFHNNSFFPHNPPHGTGHGPNPGQQDLEPHPQSTGHFQ